MFTIHDIQSYKILENAIDGRREELGEKQERDLNEQNRKAREEKTQLKSKQDKEVSTIDGKIHDLQTRVSQQEQALQTANEELVAKKAQLEELKAQKEDRDARMAEAISPENLTSAYMDEFHSRFNKQIRAIKGKVPDSVRKRWVNNRAPVDANGRPMTAFDSNGNLIGKPAGYLFPDMDCSKVSKVNNYCTMAAVSCLNATDKKCGIDIISTDPFLVDGEKVTPYVSGKGGKKVKDGVQKYGETLELCPYGIPACFGDTTYVSGFNLRHDRLIRRDNGEKGIDGNGRVSESVIKYDENSTIGKICRPENLKTDEKTGEKYYEYIDKNGNRQYLKDGDLLCLKVGQATNSSTGTHTIVLNIDQETGKVTHTSGNWDAVNGSMDGYANSKTKLLLKDAKVAVFHTSEFAHDKIASLSEEERKKIARNLGLLDNDKVYDDKIVALEAEIANDEQRLAEQQKALDETKTALAAKESEKANMLITHEQQRQGLDQKQQQNMVDLQLKQEEEKASFEAQATEFFKQLYSNYEIDLSPLDLLISGNKETESSEENDDFLFGQLKNDHEKYGLLYNALDTKQDAGNQQEYAVDRNKGKSDRSQYAPAVAYRGEGR